MILKLRRHVGEPLCGLLKEAAIEGRPYSLEDDKDKHETRLFDR